MAEKDVECYMPCDARVDSCGHSCRRNCHLDNDPDHLKYQCEQPCSKPKAGCKEQNLLGDRGDHQCARKCYENCDPCNVEVTRKRSSCTHTEKIACCKDVNETDCKNNCRGVLPCGHFCKMKCFQPCGGCTQIVDKKADCGHIVKGMCSKETTSLKCQQKCERKLKCGHKCQGKCNEKCADTICKEIIDAEIPSPCGHKVKIPCYKYALYTLEKLPEIHLVWSCTAACPAVLECSHRCAGPCGACCGGRLHAPCRDHCGRNKFCGHLCKEPCNKVCPPCPEKCQLKCPHAICRNQCGKPCVLCQEPCLRGCVHGRCSRRCGEACSVVPCREPCSAMLPCGHPCRGLCGEPCPDICKRCKPDEFPKDFFGDEFDDDEKFITLEDCGHVLDLDSLDGIMNAKIEGQIGLPKCPSCRVPIMNTYRYKDLINNLIQNDINPIKAKVFGTKEVIAQKRKELEQKLKEIQIKPSIDLGSRKKLLDKIKLQLRSAKVISLPQIEKYSVLFNIIEILDDIFISKSMDTTFRINSACSKQLTDFFDVIYYMLNNNSNTLSLQQQMDIQIEIKRIQDLVKILEMEMQFKLVPGVPAMVKKAKDQICTWRRYDQDKTKTLLEELASKYCNIILKKEREMIVKAIGLKEGHWFKCPNGHPYCIADCGGAMVESVCADCGAKIGGRNHRLRDDNTLASEMDGAAHAAWSDARNMLNYHFD